MAIITYDDLSLIREKFKDKKIVYCAGVFDLTHVGHILFFEDCKKLGDILVVLTARDSFVHDYKGNDRPILNENIRLKTIDSFKPVDYVILDKTEKFTPETGHIACLRYMLSVLRPDIYVINNDVKDKEERKRVAEEYDVQLVILQRTCPKEFDDISTSKIIEKIKKMK